jgi:hypothetical protein
MTEQDNLEPKYTKKNYLNLFDDKKNATKYRTRPQVKSQFLDESRKEDKIRMHINKSMEVLEFMKNESTNKNK